MALQTEPTHTMIAGLAYNGYSLASRSRHSAHSERRDELKREADLAMSRYDQFVWRGLGGKDPVRCEELLVEALAAIQAVEDHDAPIRAALA